MFRLTKELKLFLCSRLCVCCCWCTHHITSHPSIQSSSSVGRIAASFVCVHFVIAFSDRVTNLLTWQRISSHCCNRSNRTDTTNERTKRKKLFEQIVLIREHGRSHTHTKYHGKVGYTFRTRCWTQSFSARSFRKRLCRFRNWQDVLDEIDDSVCVCRCRLSMPPIANGDYSLSNYHIAKKGEIISFYVADWIDDCARLCAIVSGSRGLKSRSPYPPSHTHYTTLTSIGVERTNGEKGIDNADDGDNDEMLLSLQCKFDGWERITARKFPNRKFMYRPFMDLSRHNDRVVKYYIYPVNTLMGRCLCRCPRTTCALNHNKLDIWFFLLLLSPKR